MIQCLVHDTEDKEILRFWARQVPRVGELLWLAANEDREQAKAANRPASYRVTEVAHWVGSSWSPSTHAGDPIHSVCLYVEPVT